MKKLVFVALIMVYSAAIFAQNIAITDDDAYTANPSAMLDVKSITKGLLVPRMTTTQRTAISSPAEGLLVYDTTEDEFFFFQTGVWTTISSGQLWSLNGSSVYLTDVNNNVGVGTTTPTGKMEIKGDASIGIDEPLFCVVNPDGDTVFAVYSEGVRIWVNDDGSKATGSRGGFAVGGLSPAKGVTNEYLRVTPDSVRIYIDDSFTASKVTGSRGGFAVGGFSPAKGSPTEHYLFVQDDSTRVYVMDSTAGFGIANIGTGIEESLVDLTTQNYFIGHQSGQKNTTGIYNQFIGYNSGFSNLSGEFNSFIGYNSGYSNTSGDKNSFYGFMSGYSNTTGLKNTFIGHFSGASNVDGNLNVFIGPDAGMENIDGAANTFVGSDAGEDMTSGDYNTYIGFNTGRFTTTCNQNTFIGSNAGQNNSDGQYNSYLGAFSGYYNQTGDNNVMVGLQTGYFNSGSNNTFVGAMAGFQNTSGGSNVFIGHRAGYSETGSWKLYVDIADLDSDNSLIYGDFLWNKLQVNDYLGIGSYPSYTLDVAGVANLNKDITSGVALRVNGDEAIWYNDTYFSWGYGGSFNYFADEIGIANTAPNVALDVIGSIEYTGTITDVSDIRLKENIKGIDNALKRLLTIKGFSYNLIGDSLVELGVSAQEVQKVFPEAVSIVDPANGYLGVSYIQLVPVLIEAVRDQQTTIENQQKEITELKKLEDRIVQLESMLKADAK
ncbi:MAG: tail fiber domain-containing protein [Bacteroidota bacterium]